MPGRPTRPSPAIRPQRRPRRLSQTSRPPRRSSVRTVRASVDHGPHRRRHPRHRETRRNGHRRHRDRRRNPRQARRRTPRPAPGHGRNTAAGRYRQPDRTPQPTLLRATGDSDPSEGSRPRLGNGGPGPPQNSQRHLRPRNRRPRPAVVRSSAQRIGSGAGPRLPPRRRGVRRRACRLYRSKLTRHPRVGTDPARCRHHRSPDCRRSP